jgi:hypothetical protein
MFAFRKIVFPKRTRRFFKWIDRSEGEFAEGETEKGAKMGAAAMLRELARNLLDIKVAR